MKYEVTTGFRAKDKEFKPGDVVTREDLGSGYSVAFKNNWLKAYAEKPAPAPQEYTKKIYPARNKGGR